MTFVSSNAQCFFVNDTQLLGVIYITDLNFFHEIHFYICMKMFAIFLLYISIKNKTSVFYAFPFSHGPRRGVSGRGDLCDFTHGLTRLRQPSSGSRRPLEGEQSRFCLCQSSQFSRVSETKEIIVMADTRVYIGCQSRFCELFRTQKVFQLRSEARFFLVTCTELEFTFRMNVYINSKINRQSIKIYIS